MQITTEGQPLADEVFDLVLDHAADAEIASKLLTACLDEIERQRVLTIDYVRRHVSLGRYDGDYIFDELFQETLLRLHRQDLIPVIHVSNPHGLRRAIRGLLKHKMTQLALRDKRKRQRQEVRLREWDPDTVWVRQGREGADQTDGEGWDIQAPPAYNPAALIEAKELFERAFSRVLEPYRTLLWDWLVRGYTQAELSARSQIPERTLRRHLAEARATVRAFLEAEGLKVMEGRMMDEPRGELTAASKQLEAAIAELGAVAEQAEKPVTRRDLLWGRGIYARAAGMVNRSATHAA
jgi:DNA-directed RNA polymerase specialized sigma24 family protein